MNTKALVGAVIALVIVGGAGGAFALGVVPGSGSTGIDGGGGGLDGGSDDATATQTSESTVVVEDTSTQAGSTTESPEPFSFVIENIEKCGDTCRNVTATITNQQDHAASGVTVRSEIYTGDNYDNQIWEGASEAGTLDAGEPSTDTKEVNLGYGEAYAVQQNDGMILIKTYVVTDNTSYVFTEERDVL